MRAKGDTTEHPPSAIRAELPAHESQLFTKQIPAIQTLLIHLEGKGRSQNTITAYAKALKALAVRADLQDTKAVELAIARYKKQNNRPATNNYKSSWVAFKTLEEKGLIKHTASKGYKNRQYSCSWLTELGAFLAIHEGAKPEALLKTAREIYPENKSLHFLIEAAPILGKHALDVLYLAVLKRGAIDETDLVSIFAAQMVNKLAPEQIKQFIAVLKRYPEQHQQSRKNLRELADLL